jgi:hypothetical protein
MAAVALIKFTQGLSVGAPGVAQAGVPAVQVDVENDNPTDIASWKIDLVYVPPGSAVPMGTLAMGNTNMPFANFLPDLVPGSYRLVLTVYTDINQTGQADTDIRCFVVPDLNGIVFPPYQELPKKLPVVGSGIPGEKPDELNLNSQPYGWDGVGTDGLLLDFMRRMSAALGSAVNFSFFDIPVGGVTVPAGQEMYVSQLITGPGILTVDGFVSGPPVTAPPRKIIQPPVLVASVNDYSPVDMSTATDVQVAASVPVSITGLLGSPVVKEKRITNRGTVPVTLEHNSGLSSPAGRMLLPLATPLVINPGDTKFAYKDPPSGGYRVAA